MIDLSEAPQGPGVTAYFDLDRTLIAGFSAVAFARDLIRSGRLDWWSLQGEISEAAAALREQPDSRFSTMMSGLAGLLVGVREATLVEIGEALFESEYVRRVHPEAQLLIDAHRARGHTLVVASAATVFQTAPIARAVGIPNVLCTELECFAGRVTGRIRRDCWGLGKLRAAQEFARVHDRTLDEAFFYSDGIEDLPLLEAVGRPRPTNPAEALERVAATKGWPVLHFGQTPAATGWELAQPLFERSARPSVGELARRALDEQIRFAYRAAHWIDRSRKGSSRRSSGSGRGR